MLLESNENKTLENLLEFYYEKILKPIEFIDEPSVLTIQIAEYSINNLKAIDLLIKSSLYSPALALVRVLSEGTILLSESIKNINLFETYVKKEAKQQVAVIKDRQKASQKDLVKFTGQDSNRLYKLLQEMKKAGSSEPICIETIAYKNGMEFIYANAYKFCSSAIHLCPHTLGKLQKEYVGEPQAIELLKYPLSDYKYYTMLLATICTLAIFEIMNDKFNLQLRAKITKLYEQYVYNIIDRNEIKDGKIFKILKFMMG
jgi:hypothetical protein